jgi:hypothetical protein
MLTLTFWICIVQYRALQGYPQDLFDCPMKGINMFRKPSLIAAASVTVAILIAISGQSQAAGTPEQRRACRADAMKLCRDYIPNVKRITACMERNLSKLSPLCRTQFK